SCIANDRSRGASAAASVWNARSVYAPCSNTRRITANADARASPARASPARASPARASPAPVSLAPAAMETAQELLPAHLAPAGRLDDNQLERAVPAPEHEPWPTEGQRPRGRAVRQHADLTHPEPAPVA